jgi:hypothetical protein
VNGKRFGIGLVLAAVATAVILSAALAARAEQPAWQRALAARSDALNRVHRLGPYRSLGAPGPGWLQALAARSEALNRAHGIGTGGQARRTAAAEAGWLRALAVRSDALNREYRLGEYATSR